MSSDNIKKEVPPINEELFYKIVTDELEKWGVKLTEKEKQIFMMGMIKGMRFMAEYIRDNK